MARLLCFFVLSRLLARPRYAAAAGLPPAAPTGEGKPKCLVPHQTDGSARGGRPDPGGRPAQSCAASGALDGDLMGFKCSRLTLMFWVL